MLLEDEFKTVMNKGCQCSVDDPFKLHEILDSSLQKGKQKRQHPEYKIIAKEQKVGSNKIDIVDEQPYTWDDRNHPNIGEAKCATDCEQSATNDMGKPILHQIVHFLSGL